MSIQEDILNQLERNNQLLEELRDEIRLHSKPFFNKKELSQLLGISFLTLQQNGWFEHIPHTPMSETINLYKKEDVIKEIEKGRIKDGSVYK